MKLVTFSYDSKTDLGSICRVIKSQKDWAHITETTWLVGGNLRYDELRDLLVPFSPLRLLIVPFDYHHWAGYGQSKEIVSFLNNHLSIE